MRLQAYDMLIESYHLRMNVFLCVDLAFVCSLFGVYDKRKKAMTQLGETPLLLKITFIGMRQIGNIFFNFLFFVFFPNSSSIYQHECNTLPLFTSVETKSWMGFCFLNHHQKKTYRIAYTSNSIHTKSICFWWSETKTKLKTIDRRKNNNTHTHSPTWQKNQWRINSMWKEF